MANIGQTWYSCSRVDELGLAFNVAHLQEMEDVLSFSPLLSLPLA
jgi:hypothetical protein